MSASMENNCPRPSVHLESFRMFDIYMVGHEVNRQEVIDQFDC